MERSAKAQTFDFQEWKRKIQHSKAETALNDRLISRKTLTEKLEVSRSTLYRWEKAGILPKPIFNRGNTVRWSETEIELWWSTAKDAL